VDFVSAVSNQRTNKKGLFVRPAAIAFVIAVSLSAPLARALQVESITVDSAWGGLGVPAHSTLLIRREADHYFAGGKVIRQEQVNALLTAIKEPILPTPSAANLGLTRQWFQNHEEEAGENAIYIDFKAGSEQQRKLFISAFIDERTIQRRLNSVYGSFHTDDYPHITVTLRFLDGSGVEIRSNSQHPFMVPWEVKRNGVVTKTYNAHISEALVGLLPVGFTNRDALTSGDQYADGLTEELAASAGSEVEVEWKSIGAELEAGDALGLLKRTYEIRRSELNSYHNLDFGKEWTDGNPHEENLEADLWRPGFPPNFTVGAFLLRRDGKTEGADDLARKAAPYEHLVLSIDWLREFWNTHSGEHALLFYVHGVSLTDKGMKIFATDMKACGREDLTEKVRAVQDQAVLIETSSRSYALEYGQGDYWIVLPDKSVILWRWQSLDHILRWKPANFPAHECTVYGTVTGGCSGATISARGEIIR
jgi:hypothetical protein